MRLLVRCWALRTQDLDEVKVGVIQNLAAFLSVLSEATRVSYLPALVEIRAETDNWRFRFMLASQLAEFGNIFPHHAIVDTLVPLSLDLCTDNVAEVRTAAIGELGKLMATLLDSETHSALAVEQSTVAPFLSTICNMASMQSCFKRCAFQPRAQPPHMVVKVLTLSIRSTKHAHDPQITHHACAGRISSRCALHLFAGSTLP